MNFRFSSSNKAEIRESRTFCTHAPCWPNQPTPKTLKHIVQSSPQKTRKQYPNRIVASEVVLIDCLQPADIVVRVRHQVDIDLPRHDAPGGVVGYVAGLPQTNYSQKNGKDQLDCHGWCSSAPELKIPLHKPKSDQRVHVEEARNCVLLWPSRAWMLPTKDLFNLLERPNHLEECDDFSMRVNEVISISYPGWITLCIPLLWFINFPFQIMPLTKLPVFLILQGTWQTQGKLGVCLCLFDCSGGNPIHESGESSGSARTKSKMKSCYYFKIF